MIGLPTVSYTHLLIADDEPDIVAMLSRFFIQKGYRVLTAANGVETLKQVEQQPDLILLDINMPDLDGLEVCQRIRAHVSCPILFLTARIEEADKLQGFSVGGDDYIVKPFSRAELEARVHAHPVSYTHLLYDYHFGETVTDEAYRQELTQYQEQHGKEALWQLLQQRDPQSAERLHSNDTKRIIRALEVLHLTGTPASQRQNTVDRQTTVSYTHLAVSKRQ